MADGWTAALAFPDAVAALAERAIAEETLRAIHLVWPVYTGWSRANNRVVLGGGMNFPLDPPTRPTTPGALLGVAAQNYASDQQLLKSHVTPGTISIGNAVPYAGNVGYELGAGRLLYEEATKAGVAIGLRRVQTEWTAFKP